MGSLHLIISRSTPTSIPRVPNQPTHLHFISIHCYQSQNSPISRILLDPFQVQSEMISCYFLYSSGTHYVAQAGLELPMSASRVPRL
jgi:hypothetical protein